MRGNNKNRDSKMWYHRGGPIGAGYPELAFAVDAELEVGRALLEPLLDALLLEPFPSAAASYLGVMSPPRPGMTGVLSDVLEALPAPKGNLLSYVDNEFDDVAGLLPAVVKEPQLLWGCKASCSRSMPESFQGLR